LLYLVYNGSNKKTAQRVTLYRLTVPDNYSLIYLINYITNLIFVNFYFRGRFLVKLLFAAY
jgi:hypothetical protein